MHTVGVILYYLSLFAIGWEFASAIRSLRRIAEASEERNLRDDEADEADALAFEPEEFETEAAEEAAGTTEET